MAGQLQDFNFDGKTGLQIEAELQTLLESVRGSVRQWESDFDGSACHIGGVVYMLGTGGDSTVSPTAETTPWVAVDRASSMIGFGSYDDLLNTATKPWFFVLDSSQPEKVGVYLKVDGSYHRAT